MARSLQAHYATLSSFTLMIEVSGIPRGHGRRCTADRSSPGSSRRMNWSRWIPKVADIIRRIITKSQTQEHGSSKSPSLQSFKVGKLTKTDLM